MRRSVAPFAMAVAVLAITPAGGGYARPLHLPTPERQPGDPVAFVWRAKGERLAALDPKTLRVHSPSTPPLGSIASWAFDRSGGDVMAIACSSTNGSPYNPSFAVRFVDLRSLKTVPPSVRLPGFARALLWSRADRLAALVETADDGTWHAMTIDLATRRVRATTNLWGEPAGVGRTGDALVVLETPRNAIGLARLTLIGGDGDVRSVPLERVSAGTSVKSDSGGGEPLVTHRVPALAVDPGGERAYVVQPDGPAAEIDLRTLQVAYHDLNAPRSLLSRLSSWLTPPAEAKASEGPRRDGRWLGGGLIAVTGSDDSRVVDPKGNVSYRTAPAGLAIVDTHDWTVRTLDPRADAVEVGGGVLLATAAYSNGPPMGLAAYGPDRKLKFRLFPHRTVWVPAVLAGRAYVSMGFDKVSGADRIAVVDLASGRVVARRRIDLPTPLLSDGPN